MGGLKWSYGRDSICAHCVAHGCRLNRTLNGPKPAPPSHKLNKMKKWKATRGRGRPMGLMGAFLQSQWNFSTRDEHMKHAQKRRYTWTQRCEGRVWLESYSEFKALFTDGERHLEDFDGDDKEPRTSP